MIQVFYRKYRPKTFEEIEGQEHVVQTLKGALLSGRVGHAYLFCGPRGTGKTTTARILAKALNCINHQQPIINPRHEKLSVESGKLKVGGSYEPCNECRSCNEINEGRSLDLIEIDAASNRGIDEIRNLKESAQVAATGGKYKVFVIDECHMLTREANNALLKLLEEPPPYVTFILATTEPHKLLDTVLSRVQRFDFRKITTDHIQKKLAIIARKEKLEIEDDALAIIASASSGSLRDAESFLNKLISYAGSKITEQQVAEALGVVPMHIHKNLFELIQQKRGPEAIAQVSYLYESGVDMENFAKQFTKYLRTVLVQNLSISRAATIANENTLNILIRAINLFIKAGSELKFSPVPQLPIELAILELTSDKN